MIRILQPTMNRFIVYCQEHSVKGSLLIIISLLFVRTLYDMARDRYHDKGKKSLKTEFLRLENGKKIDKTVRLQKIWEMLEHSYLCTTWYQEDFLEPQVKVPQYSGTVGLCWLRIYLFSLISANLDEDTTQQGCLDLWDKIAAKVLYQDPCKTYRGQKAWDPFEYFKAFVGGVVSIRNGADHNSEFYDEDEQHWDPTLLRKLVGELYEKVDTGTISNRTLLISKKEKKIQSTFKKIN